MYFPYSFWRQPSSPSTGGRPSTNDTDVNNFIICANLTNPIFIAAILKLVSSLKSAGLWTLFDAIYPFVGGNASSHSCNLRDTTKFSITWSGGMTHDASGITGDGISGYGDTNFNPTVVGATSKFSLNSASLGAYSRTNAVNESISNVLMACHSNSINSVADLACAGDVVGGSLNDADGNIISDTFTGGTMIISRTSSSNVDVYSSFNSGSNVSNSVLLINSNLYILAENDDSSSPTSILYTAMNLAFCFIGSSLSLSQVNALRPIILQYQTDLGRA